MRRALVILVCSVVFSDDACAHGGRGVRGANSGYESELRLARIAAEDLDAKRTPGGSTDAPPRGSAQSLATNVRTADYDWRQWWALNRWSVLPERADLMRRRARWAIQAGEPLPDIAARRADRRAQRIEHVETIIIPALMTALSPAARESDEVRAAAVLALGKVARDIEAVETIWAHAQNAANPLLVRRCATLALGLLRRSRAGDQFPGAMLDVQRRRLLALFDDEAYHRTGRAFAAYALGLLADQPFGPGTLDGKVIARALWRRLDEDYRAHDLPVALLTALSMHHRAALPPGAAKGLTRMVEGAWIQKRHWNHYERGHAMSAQARLHAVEWNRIVWYVNSTQRKFPTFIRMSTFLALADQVAAVPDDYRKTMAVSLIVSMRAARNTLTRGLAHVSMARLLNEDLRQGSETILEDTRALKWLSEEARYRGEYYVVRSSFAALGLGLVAHDLGPGVKKGEAVRTVTARTLRNILANDKNRLFRASVVAALGCTDHDEAVEPLLGLLGPRVRLGRSETFFAPVALGQLGRRDARVLNALRRWHANESSPAELRSQLALGMVMLGDPDARTVLLHELAATRSTWAAAQVVLGIGLHDDPGIVEPIRKMAEDRRRGDGVRAYAYAALGFLGDPEDRGSILKLLIGSNYVLRTESSTLAQTIL